MAATSSYPLFDLATPITRLRSVGARSAARLARIGIRTTRDLLWHIPTRYEDYSQSVPIAQIVPGEKMSIQGRVLSIASKHIWPRRLTITTATIQDDSGAVRAIWFNQPYLEESLQIGTAISLAGKVVLDKRGLYLSSPIYEKIDSPTIDHAGLRHTGRLIPVYPETEGVTSKYLRYLIQPILENLALEDPIPTVIRRRYGLPDLNQALKTLHYPETADQIPTARARLAFDDILLFQLTSIRDRRAVSRLHSPRVPMDSEFMRSRISELPFKLTRDQRVAAVEILRDMERPYPMNRLLEGDVGSGKTVVAFLAAVHAARLGLQTVILAPTEVLAHQHNATIAGLLPDHGVNVALITGSDARINNGEATRSAGKKAISAGVAKIVIGTHAVIEDDVQFSALGLVVIDEQHRFGVNQRAALLRPGRAWQGRDRVVPHLLSMTATPIPRTLALTIFGDLDISTIREKPAGRGPIVTQVVGQSGREKMYQLIRDQVSQGRQVFVICPRIDIDTAESVVSPKGSKFWQSKLLWSEVKAVQDERARLAKDVFPDLHVAMLHGRMKPKEKQIVMREFKEGWHDILVSTSVIEVGVDVPNATVMLIEGADRFGLAQLHQFRGRVGRAEHGSYCFLAPTDEGAGRARLKALEKTENGFELAEADMKIRGPGEFFGIKQSGMPDLTMAALADVELIKKARAAARAITKADPDLKRYPLLRAQLDSFRKLSHFE